MRRILQEVDLHDIQLILEVTERSLLSTSGRILERIRELKQLGIQMSMDDFGMGHSSMMYLQENAFDEVKLDGSLVRQILEMNVRVISCAVSQGLRHLCSFMSLRNL